MAGLAERTEARLVEPAMLRKAMSKFATGVTVVTAKGPRGWVGMTVNSFSSVSLSPPLVLWSIGRQSTRLPVFKAAEISAVHVLNHRQHDVCMDFTRNAHAFDREGVRINSSGMPEFDGTLARFECRRHAVHDGGDHLIFVAAVTNVTMSDTQPLIFFNGAFGSFEAKHPD